MWWTDYEVGVVMKSLRAGFSLIELMIVVAIIGILAAIAIPSYQDYVARARVSEGLTMASSIKTVVTEYWIANNRWPTDATEAGLPAASAFSSSNVQSIGYAISSSEAGNAQITITYTAAAGAGDGATLVLTADTTAQGRIAWTCTDGTMDNRFRPASCRSASSSE